LISKQYVAPNMVFHPVNESQLLASSIWIRFSPPEDLLAILDKLLEGRFDLGTTTRTHTELVDSLFSVLGSSTSIPTILSALNERLTSLSEFCLSETGSSATVQSVFAKLLKRSLPLGYDGCLVESDTPLSQVLLEAEDCWARRLEPLAPGIRIETFLSTDTWTKRHVDIITPLLYRSRTVRTAFASWLERGKANELGVDLLVPLLHGFLDSCPPEYVVKNRTWDGYFSQLLKLVWDRHESSSAAVRSAALVFQFSEDRTHITSMLSGRLARSPVETVSYGVLALASKMWSLSRQDSESYVGAVIDHALRWAVRCLSDGSKVTESDTALLRELGRFCDKFAALLSADCSPILRSPDSTDQKRKSPPGRTSDCIRDQASSAKSRGRLLMHNTSPTMHSEGEEIIQIT
jgi:hypothetical protein